MMPTTVLLTDEQLRALVPLLAADGHLRDRLLPSEWQRLLALLEVR